MSNNMKSKGCLFFIILWIIMFYSRVLIANWRIMCVSLGLTRLIEIYIIGNCVYFIMFTVHLLCNYRAYYEWLHRHWWCSSYVDCGSLAKTYWLICWIMYEIKHVWKSVRIWKGTWAYVLIGRLWIGRQCMIFL